METAKVLLPVLYSASALQHERDGLVEKVGAAGLDRGSRNCHLCCQVNTASEPSAGHLPPCLPATASFSGDSMDSVAKCRGLLANNRLHDKQVHTTTRCRDLLLLWLALPSSLQSTSASSCEPRNLQV